jgi:putative endopeptidase
MRSGLDLTHIDKNVRPQDDLFRFMNGKWLTESKIPDDRASDGAFYWLYEQAEKQVKQIILDQAQLKAAVGSNAQKIGDLYNSFMDEEFIQAQGLSPIAADLKAAQSFKSLDEFLTLLGELEARGLSGLFYTYVSTDNKDSTKNIVYLGQSGLSLPDEAYYREDEYQEIRESFLAHIQKMFELAKLENPSQSAQEVLSIETKIASFHWDQVKDRDAELTYNKMGFDQLIKLAPSFNWPLWIEKSQTPAHVLSQVIIRQPSYLEGLGKLLTEFDLGPWRSWMSWHVLSGASPYLSTEFVNENFNFYGTTLSGIPKLKDRWKRAVGLVEGALGEAVGQIYVQRHFGEAAKERMVDLVKNLITAYRTSIAGLDWMSQETKEKAFVKLEKFTPKIGYPDKWRDYSKLSIKPKDLIGNLAAISKYSQEYEYAKIGKPVDKSEWYMTPQTVNAYYNPGMNEIVFPAAILQPPFFDVLADDDAANYGGIGAVIGHEIGHGFDDQGSKYDGDGNLVNWWSDGDRAEFEKRTNKLIDQYNQLSPAAAPDVKVNGALTVGENIGDLGGLTIAYKAYEISLAGQEPPVIDGYTGAQRFFMGWAQSWRGKYRAEEVRRRIATDPHSPDEFRCNQIVANLDEFYKAFALNENDQHYLPADTRVRIW